MSAKSSGNSEPGGWLLNYKADWTTALILVVVLSNYLALWATPGISFFHTAISLLFALPVASISHNHFHSPTFRSPWLNRLTDAWITFFYGMPCSVWIGVHVRSHHAHHNHPDRDVTSTAFGGNETRFRGLLRYYARATGPFFSANAGFIRDLYARKKPAAFYFLAHIVGLYSAEIALLCIDWRKTLVSTILPQQFAITMLSLFNYCQHVRTEHDKPLETSRNFTGRVFNAYVLNAGFHTVHHLKPGLHWSLIRREFERTEAQIPNHLKTPSLVGYFFRSFFLGAEH